MKPEYPSIVTNRRQAIMEPAHVHVRSGQRIAKYWLTPVVLLAESYEMSPAELKEIENVVRENQSTIKEAWDDHLGSHSGE